MKKLVRKEEPSALTRFRSAMPQATWDQMRNDAEFDGRKTYDDCREDLINCQSGLCAYCEVDIRDNNPLKCRIEHFHPKSDVTPEINWALDWGNFLAVCAGGSFAYAGSADHILEPIAENLSCDAHKDRMIQIKKLEEKCEGWVLNPYELMAAPSLFKLDLSTGRLHPNPEVCDAHAPWPNNKHLDTKTLVQYTIDMLNLNCARLSEARVRIIRDINRNKKKQREAGHTPQQGLQNLARYYFRQRWPRFFTTIRLCLGDSAEFHLAEIQFEG